MKMASESTGQERSSVRECRILEIQHEIARGTYVTPDKIKTTEERLWEVLERTSKGDPRD